MLITLSVKLITLQTYLLFINQTSQYEMSYIRHINQLLRRRVVIIIFHE